MKLVFNDGTEIELEGQFGTAKRKLAEMDGTDPADIAELKTEDGKRLVVAPGGASWSYLIQK